MNKRRGSLIRWITGGVGVLLLGFSSYADWLDETIGGVSLSHQRQVVGVDSTIFPPTLRRQTETKTNMEWSFFHSATTQFDWGTWVVAGFTQLRSDSDTTSIQGKITEFKLSIKATDYWFLDMGVLRSRQATAYFMSPSRLLYEMQTSFAIPKWVYEKQYQGNIGISTDYFLTDSTIWAGFFPAVSTGNMGYRYLPAGVGFIGYGFTDGWGIAHQLIYFRNPDQGIGWNGSWQLSPEWTVYTDMSVQDMPIFNKWGNQVVAGVTYTHSKEFQVTMETYQNGQGLWGKAYDDELHNRVSRALMGFDMGNHSPSSVGFGLGRYYQFGRMNWEVVPKWNMEWVGVINLQDGSTIQSGSVQWVGGDHWSLQGTYMVLAGGDRSEFGMNPDKWGGRLQISIY